METLETTNKTRAVMIYRRRKEELLMTREQAAKRCKVSTQSFVRAENPNKNVDIETLRAIAAGLGLPLNELLGVSAIPSYEKALAARLRLLKLVHFLDDSEVSDLLSNVEAFLGLSPGEDVPVLLKKTKDAR